MMNRLFIVFFICLSFMHNQATAAQSIDELLNQNKLKVSLQVNQSESQIAGQALILSIKVATDRWFATGSQIQNFSLQNVVMQADSIETYNGSERIKGKTWATQTHEITLYPTKAGIYQLPEININVSVNSENGVVSGTVSTEALTFEVSLPEELQGIDNFIVSPNASIDVVGLFDEENDYAVGEAITQTITIKATGMPAMMIPEVIGGKSAIDGVSVYHKPAQILDKSNRGELLATRVESFTYIFEKPGNYSIDEQVIYWWNTENESLERLIVPGSTWSVAGGSASQDSPLLSFKGFNISRQNVKLIAVCALLIIMIYYAFKQRHNISQWYNELTKRDQRLVLKQFIGAVAKKDYLNATQYLHQYALLKDCHTETIESDHLNTLNTLAFANKDESSASLSFTVNDAKELIKLIDSTKENIVPIHNFDHKKRIKLNQ